VGTVESGEYARCAEIVGVAGVAGMVGVVGVVVCLGHCNAAQLDVLEGRHRGRLDLVARRRQEGLQPRGVPLHGAPARLLPERRQLVEQALDDVDHTRHGASRRVDRRGRVRLEPCQQLHERLVDGSQRLTDFVSAALD
jgi:hypothetical protein